MSKTKKNVIKEECPFLAIKIINYRAAINASINYEVRRTRNSCV